MKIKIAGAKKTRVLEPIIEIDSSDDEDENEEEEKPIKRTKRKSSDRKKLAKENDNCVDVPALIQSNVSVEAENHEEMDVQLSPQQQQEQVESEQKNKEKDHGKKQSSKGTSKSEQMTPTPKRSRRLYNPNLGSTKYYQFPAWKDLPDVLQGFFYNSESAFSEFRATWEEMPNPSLGAEYRRRINDGIVAYWPDTDEYGVEFMDDFEKEFERTKEGMGTPRERFQRRHGWWIMALCTLRKYDEGINNFYWNLVNVSTEEWFTCAINDCALRMRETMTQQNWKLFNDAIDMLIELRTIRRLMTITEKHKYILNKEYPGDKVIEQADNKYPWDENGHFY